jgi:hypothetical protein
MQPEVKAVETSGHVHEWVPAPAPDYSTLSAEERRAKALSLLESAAAHLRADRGFLSEVTDLAVYDGYDGEPLPQSYGSDAGNMDADELRAHIAAVERTGHAAIRYIREALADDLHERVAALNHGLEVLALYPEARTLWGTLEDLGAIEGRETLIEHWLPEWDEDQYPPPGVEDTRPNA